MANSQPKGGIEIIFPQTTKPADAEAQVKAVFGEVPVKIYNSFEHSIGTVVQCRAFPARGEANKTWGEGGQANDEKAKALLSYCQKNPVARTDLKGLKALLKTAISYEAPATGPALVKAVKQVKASTVDPHATAVIS